PVPPATTANPAPVAHWTPSTARPDRLGRLQGRSRRLSLDLLGAGSRGLAGGVLVAARPRPGPSPRTRRRPMRPDSLQRRLGGLLEPAQARAQVCRHRLAALVEQGLGRVVLVGIGAETAPWLRVLTTHNHPPYKVASHLSKMASHLSGACVTVLLESGKPLKWKGNAMTDTADRLRKIADELGERFYERGEVVRTLITTVLAGQHSLVLGPPGTAKSELARELTSRIEDARYWEILLSKFTDPKRMFGPIDVAALSRGQYRQVYEGRATPAHIAFIDEVFKCSTAALNETLALRRERRSPP